MIKLSGKYSSVVTHILAALAISSIVNFSYLLILIADDRDYGPPELRESECQDILADVSGRLSLNPDGYGYLICDEGSTVDSVYISQWSIKRIEVSDGDHIVATALPSNNTGGHYRLREIKSINDIDFDYGTLYNRPGKGVDSVIQILFFLASSLLIIIILTTNIDRRKFSFNLLMRRSVWCLLLTIGIFFLAPIPDRHTGNIMPVFAMRTDPGFNSIVILKCTFTLVASILYACIYTLRYQRQGIVLENEKLKSENLATRYNVLVNQINPHFFFNSLNSLATLIRENDKDKALTYIDRLSYTFRYILRTGQNMTVTLREELNFVEAYGYQFKIRYEDKLFIDMNVDEKYYDYTLPSLSLQPLIDNAVKHNAITQKRPMHIYIGVDGERLVVSNPKYPLLNETSSTGIGLKNLRSRWQLITGHDIEIIDGNDTFTVKLPLQKSRA